MSASAETGGRSRAGVKVERRSLRRLELHSSLPRYALGGSVNLPYIGRWVADRLGLGAPLELMDPFSSVEVKAPQASAELAASGPEFLQAFGLALRGL